MFKNLIFIALIITLSLKLAADDHSLKMKPVINLSFGSNTDGSGAITVYGTTRLVDGSAFTGSTDNVNDDYYGFIVVEGGQFRTSEGNPKRCRGIKQTGGTIT